ncbi:MAG TPA: 50S ribosomal protein L4 [Candidatus Woesebacteria bacterium]|nr:50S ribosomal protein L4 [Candidatus Woesebacteria bacterium]
MKAPLYNLKAENIGETELEKSVFGTEIKTDLIATAIRVYQSNIRSSHAKAKDRGEVAGTTKKMWAQKGTGRARHGSAKAAQFVGGGVAHGPTGEQNYSLKLNQKVKQLVVKSILSLFAKNKSIIVIDDFSTLAPKTKEAWNFVELLEKQNQVLEKSKKIGIITLDTDKNVARAFRNIPGINLLSVKSLNALNLSQQNCLIFSQKALTELK